MPDEFQSPLRPSDLDRPSLAPPWVALTAAWLGLITLLMCLAFPFLPGSQDNLAELENRQPYSFADKFLPYPMYLSVVAMFVGIVVLRQMRREPRPLPDALIAQRVQAWAGIWLSTIGAAFIYVWVAFRGPR